MLQSDCHMYFYATKLSLSITAFFLKIKRITYINKNDRKKAITPITSIASVLY